jgi:hypothetical protein
MPISLLAAPTTIWKRNWNGLTTSNRSCSLLSTIKNSLILLWYNLIDQCIYCSDFEMCLKDKDSKLQ